MIVSLHGTQAMWRFRCCQMDGWGECLMRWHIRMTDWMSKRLRANGGITAQDNGCCTCVDLKELPIKDDRYKFSCSGCVVQWFWLGHQQLMNAECEVCLGCSITYPFLADISIKGRNGPAFPESFVSILVIQHVSVVGHVSLTAVVLLCRQ